ncbi:MAG: tetratricopeptide repeat protein [Acidobacteria bacterium]|nr:MAG: tetratricopeptide repeat protein [Acidobacteriota bacterium]
MHLMRSRALSGSSLPGAGVLIGLLLTHCSQSPSVEPSSGIETDTITAATFVGRQACAGCHSREVELWEGSHHDLAMQVADENTVLGDFDDATFTYNGITSIFFKREEKFLVRTDGPEGALREYEIAYTFGLEPLQQYLIAFPGGRYQALSISWDTRPAQEGGQRWFHLYPDEKILYDDPLHWTAISQNWNHMCAECHSTQLKKNYLEEEDRYETIWSEIDVSCEACHGPASAHLAWAEALEAAPTALDPDQKGLVFQLREMTDVSWSFQGDSGIARRSPPRGSNLQLETCARCHARRGILHEDYQHGRPLMDTHRPALLEESLYYPDGQIREEVYVYGSFLQSKMYRQGVTCSDCHDPHSLKLHGSEDGVCQQCHLPEKFETPSHHFHPENSSGASCVECHMPASTYMLVDPRRDHSFRIPRPDLSLKLDTPNPCTGCHTDRSSSWAAQIVTGWYGSKRSDQPHFGEALHAGRNNLAQAERDLARLADNPSMPGIARATALTMLPGYSLGPESRQAMQNALKSSDPLLRASGLIATEVLEPPTRLGLAFPLLSDPIRAVRLQAGRVLASVPSELWTSQQRSLRDSVLDEYRQSQQVNADRPEAHLNLGVLHQQLGELEEAERAYQRALSMVPSSVPVRINLADLYREQNRDEEGETLLRQTLVISPDDGDVHHALGLLLVRQNRYQEALAALGQAARLRPESWRYSYILAVALHETGQVTSALQTLKKAHDRHPDNLELLMLLTTLNRDNGRLQEAILYANKLIERVPENAMFRQLLAQLEAALR